MLRAARYHESHQRCLYCQRATVIGHSCKEGCPGDCLDGQVPAAGVVAHARSSNPFPVRQDDDYLYLVMEYLPGGDVMVSTTPARRN